MAGFAVTRFSIRLSRSPHFLLTPPFRPHTTGFLQPMPVVELAVFSDRLPERFGSVKMHAVNKTKDNGPKWWERNASPNMIDVHSAEDFLNALNQAQDRLVMVEFYGNGVPHAKHCFQRKLLNKTKDNGPKWWERNASPNMIDVHSAEDFLNALNQAQDRLVMVEFCGTWCASCKALFPKLCRTVAANSDILFVKVNFDENKLMCKRLNVNVLPYFHVYHGADGLLEAFSCTLPKLHKIKDAIATHSTARCSLLGSPTSIWDLNLLVASTTNMLAESSLR